MNYLGNKNYTLKNISIIGLGYVGLPLLIAFSKFYKVVGFDIDINRIKELKNGFDRTREVKTKELVNSNLFLTSQKEDLKHTELFIVTVPTPVLKNKNPDLRNLISSMKLICPYVKKNSIICLESTVYPGVSEDICVPIIEKRTKLKLNKDFYFGYSPERINPGDEIHTLTKITKVISGSNDKSSKLINSIYSKVLNKNVYMAKNIQTAEMAKVFENIQRDVNIALVNELTIICSKLKLSVSEVLETANTKWNFLNFKPGLVGGHCIGVDPYYLLYLSKKIKYQPNLITSGRKLNDSMHKVLAKIFLEKLFEKFEKKKILKILILGYTFKENCPDRRNTRINYLINSLKHKNLQIDLYDPYIKKIDKKNFPATVLKSKPQKKYDSIILTVPHRQFIKDSNYYLSIIKSKGFIFDIKNSLPKNDKIIKI